MACVFLDTQDQGFSGDPQNINWGNGGGRVPRDFYKIFIISNIMVINWMAC